MFLFCGILDHSPMIHQTFICDLCLYFIFINGFTAKLIWSERVKSVSLFSTDWMIVASQMKVVLLWLLLWDQTPHTWENWICLGINWENQWICSLMYYNILTVNWRYCGKIIYDKLKYLWLCFLYMCGLLYSC